MANKVTKLITHINTIFYDWADSQEILVNNSIFKDPISKEKRIDAINDVCNKISKKNLNSASLQDDKRYFHIAFADYFEYKRNEQDKLIFEIDNKNGNYFISTGLYCGVINFGDKLPQIEIRTGYSDLLLKRMLNYCCGIYADTNTEKSSSENESIYSLLIQYLFLVSLRNVANKSIPRRYVYLKERGYDIKGNIDINEYVNNDIIAFDKKITYQHIKRLEIQSIIDVLHAAMNCCKITFKNDCLPKIGRFKNYLNELYSGQRPSRKVIDNAINDKCLKNSLYLDFKRPIEYAKILLSNNELNSGNDKKTPGLSGFLVDASFLWEMYLCNLMRLKLTDWDVDCQSEISFYEGTFYKTKNYPDFVLRHKKTRAVYILDAKFKRMTYQKIDIDNHDLQQLHSYSYFFHLKNGERFKGSGLIYPAKIDQPSELNNKDKIFGLKQTDVQFGIFSLKDPAKGETITDNENNFIKALKEFLSA